MQKNEVLSFQGEERSRQFEQTEVLLKTIYLLSSIPVNVYILNNDDETFNTVVSSLDKWNVDFSNKLKLYNVEIKYPIGLQEMINMFR